MIRTAYLAAVACLLATAAFSDSKEALPFDVGGAYALTDQSGNTRTQADPDGNHQLLFFGYATCQQICSAALPLMAEVADALDADGIGLTPLMITIDPERDTVDTIGPALALHHPNFIGLTGSEDKLQVAYDAFSVEREYLFDDPEYGPVYAHGSFLYLLDPAGEVLTLVPPILAPDALSKIVKGYAEGTS